MSRKSTEFLLASIEILRLFRLKITCISFFINSVCLGVLRNIASPSSLYNPTFISRCSNWDSIYRPIKSHVSASSKLSFATSKSESPRLFHSIPLLYSVDFLVCSTMRFHPLRCLCTLLQGIMPCEGILQRWKGKSHRYRSK